MNEDKYIDGERLFGREPSSAVDIIDALLNYAVGNGASDIHIDPAIQGVCIRLRLDGQLIFVDNLSSKFHEETIARLKILSGARTDIHSVPQDGRFRMIIAGKPFNIRISFMPTYHGENAVLRLLPENDNSRDTFAMLGFTPEHVVTIGRAISRPNGMILVTGPTGSGKTTTLRVCLGLKAAESISVMTLEDPVEYEVPGVRHVHIRESYGVTFASALRSALRQDPDVIMVGEIRDKETARTAINTALTGHLVLSTLHTNSAIETILRLIDMGVERYLITATLRLIVSQRLVRMVCQNCQNGGGTCANCQGTGYKGRSVIAEVLEMDDGLCDLIDKSESQKSIRDYLRGRGFKTINEDATEKVDWGVTTQDEIIRALNV